ncbi:MAG: hypothetical protein IKV18_00430 [Alistipes sp.]|nr:hypothetical protein [Alistipes sp.]
MKRILIFTLGVIALATFISCQKDNDEQDAEALAGKGSNEQISTTLANSVWSSGRNGYQEEAFVEFTDSENAIYTIIENVDGTERLKQKIEYHYTYNSPNITLMPKDFVNNRLRGQMARHDKGHEYLYLTSDVDSLELYLTKTDEDIKIESDSTDNYSAKF